MMNCKLQKPDSFSNILFYDNFTLCDFVLLALNKLSLSKPYAFHVKYIVRYKRTIMNKVFEMIDCPARKWANKPIKCTVNCNTKGFRLIIIIALPYTIWLFSNINPLCQTEKKTFDTNIYSYHLQMKLVLLCYSVKLPSCPTCLVIRRTRSILNSHIFHNNLFWLSGFIYLLRSKAEKTETPYLASLLS